MPNVFLGLFYICYGLGVLTFQLEVNNIAPFLLSKVTSLAFPFLFFYVTKTIGKKTKVWWYSFFAPGLMGFLPLDLGEEFSFFLDLVFGAFEIWLLLYLFFVLRKHQKEVGEYYSDLELKTLTWVQHVVSLFLVLSAFWLFEFYFDIHFPDLSEVVTILTSIVVLSIFIWVGKNGMFQITLPEKLLVESGRVVEKENRDGDVEMFQKMDEKIRTEKVFKDNNLTLGTLAQVLEINEKEISRLINQQGNMNFYKYINMMRVEEFKTLVNSQLAEKMSIMGLAEEVGFKSKSTFYNAFKSVEGITPKQYEKSIKEMD